MPVSGTSPMTDRPADARAPDSPQVSDGTPFGRYRLIELLGRGGMGEVWRAFDTATERVVAVKVLPEHLSHDDVFQQRFRREARAAASLNSPHVIPIHNHGEIDGRLYVDMRLIEGRDLQTILADGPLGPGRAVRIVEQVARALHSAHKVGLVHRDVKPSNILLDEDDYAYLIDFGIARAEGDSGLTGTSGFIGSWHYMAPEALQGRRRRCPRRRVCPGVRALRVPDRAAALPRRQSRTAVRRPPQHPAAKAVCRQSQRASAVRQGYR